MSFVLDNGVWKEECPVMDKDGNESFTYRNVFIIDVPVVDLLCVWEDLVNELSEKEGRLLTLKEYIASESFHIETTFDFKEAYGKNNADIRKHHIKVELSDVFDEVRDLELSINWTKGYVPLLRECIKCKRD
jgi:hypothetical protein